MTIRNLSTAWLSVIGLLFYTNEECWLPNVQFSAYKNKSGSRDQPEIFLFCLQAAAETAYDVVSPASPAKRGQNRLAQQPADLREGFTNAYQVFKEVSGVPVYYCFLILCLLLWLRILWELIFTISQGFSWASEAHLTNCVTSDRWDVVREL